MDFDFSFDSDGSYFDGLCTVTLQGGGVFGFALLGQLAAIEEAKNSPDEKKRLRPAVYAGASAGGLMASLVWAGFRVDDILRRFKDLVDNRSLLVSVLGAKDSGQWSASPENVLKARDRLSRILGLTDYEGHRFARWLSWSRDLVGLSRFASTAHAAWGAGGLFAAQGFTDWLDELFRLRLECEIRDALTRLEAEAACGNPDATATLRMLPEWLNEIELPHPSESSFKSHRPRFVDFDFVRYSLSHPQFFPALMLSVTNLSIGEAAFIDSYSSCFEHLVISDVVRATVSFPFVFQPVMLPMIQEESQSPGAKPNRMPTRESLWRHHSRNGNSKIVMRNDLFIDGGVMANFPVWALGKSVRQMLYGHTNSGAPENLRLWRGARHQAPAREAFVKRGTVVAPDVHFSKKEHSEIPLRALAFRPMLHIGLRLVDGDSSPVRIAGIRLLDVLTSGARRFHERNALAEGSRLVLTDQTEKGTGWSHDLLAFDRLSTNSLDVMFKEGYRVGQKRIQWMAAQFKIPTTNRRSIGGGLPSLEETIRGGAAGMLDIMNVVVPREVPNVFSGCRIICNIDLFRVEQDRFVRFWVNPDHPSSVVTLEQHNSPEVICYNARSPIVARYIPSMVVEFPKLDKSVISLAKVCFPIIDQISGVSVRQSRLDTIRYDSFEASSGISSRPGPNVISLGQTTNSVILGILSVDLQSVGDGRVTVENQAKLIDAFWAAVIRGSEGKRSPVATALLALHDTAEKAGALLSERLSRASESEALPSHSVSGIMRRQDLGFTELERDILGSLYSARLGK